MLEPLPPLVRVRLPSVTLPAPASEPIDKLLLLSAKMAPLETVMALPLPKAVELPACKVPALTVVGPRNRRRHQKRACLCRSW